MSSCCVVNCTSAYYKKEAGVKFFSFPWKDYEANLRERWILAINRENPDGSSWHPRKKISRVCSKHFPNGIRSSIWGHPASVPSILPKACGRNTNEKKGQNKAERQRRLMKRRQRPPEPDVPEPHLSVKVGEVRQLRALGPLVGYPHWTRSGSRVLGSQWASVGLDQPESRHRSACPGGQAPKRKKLTRGPGILSTVESSNDDPTDEGQPSKKNSLYPHAVPSQKLPLETDDIPPTSHRKRRNKRVKAESASTGNTEEKINDESPRQPRSPISDDNFVGDMADHRAFIPSILRRRPFIVNKKLTCSAPSCLNSQANGHLVFRFPSDPTRRKAWALNCIQVKWWPTSESRICDIHFDDDQWDLEREDGQKVLKPNAIPSIFFIDSHQEVTNQDSLGSDDSPTQYSERSTTDLIEEIVHLKDQLKEKEQILKLFLSDDQITALENDGTSSWSRQSIDQGFKFRLNLGTHGYNFLRSTNYPLPAISTLNNRLGSTAVHFGVFEDLTELVQYKVQALDPLDRLCTISLDEMAIDDLKGFHEENHRHLITGQSKNDNNNSVTYYITVVLIRGIKSPWEQVIGCESLAHATEGVSQKTLLEKSISFAEECGLRVLSVSSNLNDNIRLMWSALGVDVTKSETERTASFNFNDHEIHVVPDVRHLLKSLKAAVDTGIDLPLSLVGDEALPASQVSTKHVKELWDADIRKKSSSRLLHHLQKEDVIPSPNDQMSIESAIRFFSMETAGALESAVVSNMITPDALSTAYFCRLIDKWYTVCDSKLPKDGISEKNKQATFNFLMRFVNILQDVKIGDGWSPVNAGLIMSTMSLCKVVDILLQQEGFGVVVLHRFSQDAVEDVISEIRKKSGSMPTAQQFFLALKTITTNQFTADIKRSDYPSKSDCVTKRVETSSAHKITKRKQHKRWPKQKGTLKGMKASKTPKCELKKKKVKRGRPIKKVAKS